VWRAHHHAFEHGLTADQGLFPAFEGKEQLEGGVETKLITKPGHR
jgi:hypothetical protein